MHYTVEPLNPYNSMHQKALHHLLEQVQIKRDKHLTYTCGIFDEDNHLIATGSYFKQTLRCLAVHPDYQGHSLLNLIVSHLMNDLYTQGIQHIFVYTKPIYRSQFKDLGFHEIVANDTILFMENKTNGFSQYLSSLPIAKGDNIAAIVMNANPFTNGHLFLVEKAVKENDWVHLFIVEEEMSEFPYAIRKQLVEQGTSHLSNISIHGTHSYLISSATFPSYFQKDDDAVILSQISVEAEIFYKIAQHLAISKRYVGSEPYSHVTNLYNTYLKQHFQQTPIQLIECERHAINQHIISASKVRRAIKEHNLQHIQFMVPASTYQFLTSPAAQSILAAIGR